MHFRQILGRILRVTNSTNQEAVMYMPAEPKLLEYAYRVKQDVPFEVDVVKFEKIKPEKLDQIGDEKKNAITFDRIKPTSPNLELNSDDYENKISFKNDTEMNTVDEHYLSTSYEKVINIFGRFKQESIALGLSELR
jgi:hypothetical protein